MKKMFVSNLPQDISEEDVGKLFSGFGKVRSVQLAFDVFSRKCRGFGFVEMEGHEARAAIAGLDGKEYGGKALRVRFDDAGKQRRGGRRR
ncbi:MAG: RNA-binding protein [Gammaproteobacteria bacterium]|jgi:RNA recognition motif-containing protein|nr:RNA-binding protein [Gammaproteobacteria bacterium]